MPLSSLSPIPEPWLEAIAERLKVPVEPRPWWGSDWVKWGIGLILAAGVAYFTTMSAITNELTTVKTTQEQNFNELLRRLDVMQQDIRELRPKR